MLVGGVQYEGHVLVWGLEVWRSRANAVDTSHVLALLELSTYIEFPRDLHGQACVLAELVLSSGRR